MFSYQIDDEITLRLLEPRHAEELFVLTEANRLYLREWLPWLDAVKSVEDTMSFIESVRRQFAENDGFQSVIWYNGSVAGVIGYHRIDWDNRSTTIGYWLGESFQGHGIVTRSCRVLIEYAFTELELNRIEIRCAANNAKSRAIPERLGFTNEGTIREAEWLYDKFVDLVIYGMLAEEWHNLKRKT